MVISFAPTGFSNWPRRQQISLGLVSAQTGADEKPLAASRFIAHNCFKVHLRLDL